MNAAITKKQFEGEWDDKFIGEQARVYSQLLPKVLPKVSKEDVALLFISQIRKKIGVMWGDEDEVAGGNAPKFYASLILHVKSVGSNKEGEEKISNKTQVYVKKNQIAPPFKKGEFNIVYGHGIDKESAIIGHAENLGIVTKSGAWYNFGEVRLGQGLKMTADMLRDSDDLKCDILAAISKGK
jgi:recombination protein RecA